MNAYRSNDSALARLTALEDKIHEMEGRLTQRRPKNMDEKTLLFRLAIVAGTIIIGITGAVVYVNIDDHHSQVQIARELTEQKRLEAAAMREEASKAMWDHYSVPK